MLESKNQQKTFSKAEWFQALLSGNQPKGTDFRHRSENTRDPNTNTSQLGRVRSFRGLGGAKSRSFSWRLQNSE